MDHEPRSSNNNSQNDPGRVTEAENDLEIDRDSLEWLKKQQAARLAMSGGSLEEEMDHLKELSKKRQEARLAMEDLETKRKREAQKAQETKELAREKKIAELRKKRLAAKKKEVESTRKSEEEAKRFEAKKRSDQKQAQEMSEEKIEQLLKSENAKLPPSQTLSSDLRQKNQPENRSTPSNTAEKSQSGANKNHTRPSTTTSKVALFGVTIILLLLATGAGILTWQIFINPQPDSIDPRPLISVTKSHEIKLPQPPENIRQELRILSSSDQPDHPRGHLANIYFTKPQNDSGRVDQPRRPARTEELLTATEVNWPRNFTYFLQDEFMLGLSEHLFPRSLFLILKTNSWENSFDTLLQNESEITAELIADLFGRPEPEINELTFKDKTIKNLDIRAGQDQTREFVVYYGFLDRTVLVFTQDRETLEHIIDQHQNPDQ